MCLGRSGASDQVSRLIPAYIQVLYHCTQISALLRNEPKAIEVMVLRAIALFLSANISDAIAQLTVALEMDPDNRRASTLRRRIIDIERLKKDGNSLFSAGQWDVAIVNWGEALEVSLGLTIPCKRLK